MADGLGEDAKRLLANLAAEEQEEKRRGEESLESRLLKSGSADFSSRPSPTFEAAKLQVQAEERALTAQRARKQPHIAARVDDALSERLTTAKAGVGELVCSVAWHDSNDLDLHCLTPAGEHLWHGHPKSLCGGSLDVDSNSEAGSATDAPVVSMFWPKDVPKGRYTFWVEAADLSRSTPPTKFTLRLSEHGFVTKEVTHDPSRLHRFPKPGEAPPASSGGACRRRAAGGGVKNCFMPRPFFATAVQ